VFGGSKLKKQLITGVLLASVFYAGGALSNDFPTQARVEYVIGCMNRLGAQIYENMYACSCSIDKIAATISYQKYVEATTLGVLIKTPGEKGGAFRDVPDAREFIGSVRDLEKSTLDSCTIKSVQAPAKKK